MHRLAYDDQGRVILYIGADNWPVASDSPVGRFQKVVLKPTLFWTGARDTVVDLSCCTLIREVAKEARDR
jgi:hypothetical protein